MESPPLRVLVISPEASVEALLGCQLPPGDFEVVRQAPGGGLVEAIRRVRPHIAVIDEVHARPIAVAMEVALLRDARPEVRVIAVSTATGSEREDARLIELGLFFYLRAATPVRLPDLVLAAARSLRSRRSSAAARRDREGVDRR
jgi:DNA-binding NtrC family response regulator